MPKFPSIPALLQKGRGKAHSQGSRRVREAKSFVIRQHTNLLKPVKRLDINDWQQAAECPTSGWRHPALSFWINPRVVRACEVEGFVFH
jgi:hypothetical protein